MSRKTQNQANEKYENAFADTRLVATARKCGAGKVPWNIVVCERKARSGALSTKSFSCGFRLSFGASKMKEMEKERSHPPPMNGI